MAVNMVKKINNKTKVIKAPSGYSFTTLFFGPLVPLIRNMPFGYFLKIGLMYLITFGISNLFFAASINDEYIEFLQDNGYQSVD